MPSPGAMDSSTVPAPGTAEGGGVEYECQLCDVHSVSYKSIQAHLRGRSHMDMVQRSEDVQRSLYLRGFTSTPTIKEDLREVMGKFGEVVSIVVKTSDDDTYALVEFSSKTAALNVLKHSSPLTLNTHTLKVKPRLLHLRKPAKRHVRSGRKQLVDVAAVTGETSNEGCSVEDGSEKSIVGGIRLTPEAVSAIAVAYSVDTQLEAIALHCRCSNAASEIQLVLAWHLQCRLRIHMPSCMVVPFGAPFSGHGTVSSDCDLSVLVDPCPLEVAMFSGPAYLPPHLMAKWEQLQTTPTDPPTSTVSLPFTLSQAEHNSELEPAFDRVLAAVKEDQHYSEVWALRQARCPIIRFIYEPHQLHCDLSVNNRLGPANTRLLAAYMNFDSRMAVLVPCVRLWARGWGIKRRQLNNYSLSLMLIHSLQHTSPPVLPCLQDPGGWPKNMAWIGSQRFSVPAEQHVHLDGWDCSFTDPRSLLTSSNTASPAQLLLHFFNYYTEFSFSEKVVAIHTPSPPNYLPGNSGDQSTGFRMSSLCVQDPFEQTHNVTKNMKASHLPSLRQAFQSSERILRSMLTNELTAQQDVLSLFKEQTLPVPDKKGALMCSLALDTATAGHLLLNTHYASLANRLSELDRNNASVQCMLNHVLLQSLALQLQREFGFRIHVAEAQESVPSTSRIPWTHTPDLEVPAGKQRKRQRPSEECEEGMEIDEEGEGEEIKRSKLSEEESAEQLLFRLTEGESAGYTLVCSAMEESWLHRRRKRREKQRVASSASPRDTGSSTPTSTSPCLSLTLTSMPAPSDLYLATVDLHVTDPKYQQSFQQFFAVLKKWILYSFPSQLS